MDDLVLFCPTCGGRVFKVSSTETPERLSVRLRCGNGHEFEHIEVSESFEGNTGTKATTVFISHLGGEGW